VYVGGVVRIAVPIAAIAAMAGCAGCSKAPAEKAPVVTQPMDAPPAKPDTRPRVTLTGSQGPVEVRVEVVATEPLIERGLMYREYLAPNDGMLFVMGAEKLWSFWMKNTLISLDILFIKADMTVAGILHEMKPLDMKSKGPGVPTSYVLEVNGGWCKAHGIDVGARVAFEGVTATGPKGGFGASDDDVVEDQGR
jgi:uncharacterized membrane protein (UPF0127 family)